MNASIKFYRILISWTLLLILIILPLYAYKVIQKQDYTDFSVYYQAAVRAKNLNWNDIYNLKDGASPFRYAPPILFMLRPLAEFSHSQAQILWYFLQVVGFSLGFFWIYRSLLLFQGAQNRHLRALSITCLTILFILRFCLDSFTIGQSSSLLFLGFCFAFHAWIKRRPIRTVLGLMIPTGFKIGPGFLLGLFLTEKSQQRNRAIQTFIFSILSLICFTCACIRIQLGSWRAAWALSSQLWKNWGEIVVNDSVYYDASHYGSQSFKSFLLRGVHWGWLSPSEGDLTYFVLAITVCIGIAGFWFLRRPRGFYGRALFFALGLFAYLWLMPETFKYSLTPLAIPVALLFSSPQKTRLCRFSLTLGALTLSLAGKDIVGDFLFFGNQIYSLPLAATLFLAGSILQLALKNSTPSRAGLFLRGITNLDQNKLGPWKGVPQEQRSLEISLLIPVVENPKELQLFRKTLSDSVEFLKSQVGNSYEVIVIAPSDFKIDSPPIRIVQVEGPQGRGAALRAGFLQCQGKKILIANPQNPFKTESYLKALMHLNSGYDLIRRKSRLNALFDTLALSWRLAATAFAVQSSRGSLVDLEIYLTSLGHGYREISIPEATQKRNSLEILSSILRPLIELPLILNRFRQGYYHPLLLPTGITADDWGLSLGVNQGILELAKMGVVRRVSIMANGAALKEGLQELISLPHIELGLHFNLTYGRPCQKAPPITYLKGAMIASPGKFLLQWMNPFSDRTLQRNYVRSELSAQFEKLREVGIDTQYLDGHHHIHLVPGLIEATADLIHAEGIQRIRLPLDFSLWKTSQAPLIFLSLLARPKLIHHGFKFIPCIYPHRNYFLDHGKLRAQLTKNPQAEVIVHPAKTNDLGDLEFPDDYTCGRVYEFRALQMLRMIETENGMKPEVRNAEIH